MYVGPVWCPSCLKEFGLNVFFSNLVLKLQINQIDKVQRTAARSRLLNMSSVGKMFDELEWPFLEGRKDQSSLFLFHKIHYRAVSIKKDKYMTPAHSLKITESSHSAQYHRHQTYCDALKNSPSPELCYIGIVCLLWPIPSPQRSLGRHSSFSQKHS